MEIKSLNPLDYSLAEVQKALVALIGFVGFAMLYLFDKSWSPGLTEALQTLVPTGIAVYTVFALPNHTPEDISKALIAFITAGVGVWQYFGTVNENTVTTLIVFAGYAGTFLAVYHVGNKKPPIDDQRKVPPGHQQLGATQ